jgi:hypothetical protein
MTDRLSLANALADAKIDRPVAERIATEIFEAIRENVATKADVERATERTDTQFAELRAELSHKADKADIAALQVRFDTLEYRVLFRLGGLIVVLFGLLFAALRYLPPPQ